MKRWLTNQWQEVDWEVDVDARLKWCVYLRQANQGAEMGSGRRVAMPSGRYLFSMEFPPFPVHEMG